MLDNEAACDKLVKSWLNAAVEAICLENLLWAVEYIDDDAIENRSDKSSLNTELVADCLEKEDLATEGIVGLEKLE